MKKIGLLQLLLVATLLCWSCSDSNDPVPLIIPEISLPGGAEDYFSKGMNFTDNAGEKTFTFSTNVDWNISLALTRGGTSWCTVYPMSGKAGTHTVRVKTEENSSYDSRSVTLTLTADTKIKSFVVSQKQKDALTLTNNKFEIDAKGGEINVEVKSNVQYEVAISEKAKGWITQAAKGRGLSTSSLLFNVAESEETEKREGEIIIKGGELSETIHVYQSGQKILLLTEDHVDASCKGDTIEVEIKSNFNYDVEMPQADWISEIMDSRAVSSHTLRYYVKPNENYDNRKTCIVFFDKESSLADTLHIQQAQKDALLLSQKEFNVKAGGEDIQLQLSSNVEYVIEFKDDWICRTATRALVDDNLTFTVKPNESTNKRTGKIIITSADRTITWTVLVNQYGKASAEGDFGGSGEDMPWS